MNLTAITNSVAFKIAPFWLLPDANKVMHTDATNERNNPAKGNFNPCKIPPMNDSEKAHKAVTLNVTLVL